MKNKNLICNIIIICLLALLIIPMSKIITIDSNAADDVNLVSTKSNTEKINLGIATQEQLKDLGDLDADGEVTAHDALKVLQYISAKASGEDVSNYDYAIKYLDSNKDGKITTIDAKLIFCYTVAGSDIVSSKTFEEFVDTFDEIYTVTEDGELVKK